MAQNVTPIFVLTGNSPVGKTITTANTAKDGTGTVVAALTGGTNGTLVKGITFRPLGTNIATVARIFLNNGSTNTSATNNVLIGELGLPPSTLTEVGEMTKNVWVPDIQNFVLPAGYVLNVTIGTTVAAGYAVGGHGGDF